MNLPSKDKNGNNYLSYSQISLFLKDREQYRRSYILKEPFITNDYIEFGSRIGKALELGVFNDDEAQTLNKVTRLDLFEQKTILSFDDFYMIGFIDTCTNDLTKIIDYKTGGKGKQTQYIHPSYTQLHYYTLSIRQELKIKVKDASVEFIERSRDFKAVSEPIKIPIDISENRLKQVYYDTIKIAKDIEKFYLENI